MFFSSLPSFPSQKRLHNLAQPCIGIQTCSGRPQLLLSTFEKIEKFHRIELFHAKMKNPEISLKRPFYKFLTFNEVHSDNTIYSKGRIAHAITCIDILLDVYQGFHVSRCSMDIRSNICDRSRSENVLFHATKPWFFRKVQSHSPRGGVLDSCYLDYKQFVHCRTQAWYHTQHRTSHWDRTESKKTRSCNFRRFVSG